LPQLLSALFRLAVRMLLRASGLTLEEQAISDMHLGGLEPGRLLDIGCGDGEFSCRIKKRGWTVDGLDFDTVAARLAEERHGLKVNICSVEEMAYPDDSFDAVTMNHVIEHLVDPLAVLRNVHRVLKPGGSFIVVTPNAKSWDFGCSDETGKRWTRRGTSISFRFMPWKSPFAPRASKTFPPTRRLRAPGRHLPPASCLPNRDAPAPRGLR
jgi:ubiquinone/menaquinone biosynthesis C-methylase UbiE